MWKDSSLKYPNFCFHATVTKQILNELKLNPFNRDENLLSVEYNQILIILFRFF